MHTETNHLDAREAPRWLWRQWHNIQLIQQAEVPVVEFTWYSLTDQVDWDIALAQPLGDVNPVVLYDLPATHGPWQKPIDISSRNSSTRRAFANAQH